MRYTIIILFILFAFKTYGQNFNNPAWKYVSCPDSVTDYDGNTYPVVKIGDQCWMGENLRVTHWPDGHYIPNPSDSLTWANTLAARSYYNDDSSTNESIYGALYKWYALMDSASSSNSVPGDVQGVCPDGWHVPSYRELLILKNYLGDNSGKKLKENDAAYWDTPLIASNIYDFNFRGAGERATTANFVNLKNLSYIQSSTEVSDDFQHLFIMLHNFDVILDDLDKKDAGYPVRCIKDY